MCVVCAPGACQAVRSGSHLTSRALGSPSPRARNPVPSNQFPTSSSGDRAFVGWPVCFVSRVWAISNSSRSFPRFSQHFPAFAWSYPMKLANRAAIGDLSLGRTYCCGPAVFTSTHLHIYVYPVGFDAIWFRIRFCCWAGNHRDTVLQLTLVSNTQHSPYDYVGVIERHPFFVRRRRLTLPAY